MLTVLAGHVDGTGDMSHVPLSAGTSTLEATQAALTSIDKFGTWFREAAECRGGVIRNRRTAAYAPRRASRSTAHHRPPPSTLCNALAAGALNDVPVH